MKSTYQERLNNVVENYNKGCISSNEALDQVLDLRTQMMAKLNALDYEDMLPGSIKTELTIKYSRLAIEAIKKFR